MEIKDKNNVQVSRKLFSNSIYGPRIPYRIVMHLSTLNVKRKTKKKKCNGVLRKIGTQDR